MDIVRTLERELAEAKKQVNALGKALEAFRDTFTGNLKAGARSSKTAGKKRHMSAAARKRISQAQKARWAKQKAKPAKTAKAAKG